MGKQKLNQSIVLVLILSFTVFFVYWRTDSNEVIKKHKLRTILGPVGAYTIDYESALDQEIYKFLDLDDYTSVGYKKDGISIGLYIGYYYSLEKVSAAHSPLVCFPGQGWDVGQLKTDNLKVGEHTVNFAEMTATLAGSKQLILYWYQAYEQTSPDAYRNKMHAFVNKIISNRQEHAFVRVSVDAAAIGEENARQVGINFIRAFYPAFLSYVKDEPIQFEH